jgi:hypothetical protein
MKIDDHLEKARAFERSLAKLDPIADTELYVVFLMRACTNRLNAALHDVGFTTDGPTGAGRIGDLNHTYKPRLDTAPPAALQPAFARLSYIEELRPGLVRGPRVLTDAEAAECRAAQADITTLTDRVFKRAGRAA